MTLIVTPRCRHHLSLSPNLYLNLFHTPPRATTWLLLTPQGVGKKKAFELFRHMESLHDITNATEQELMRRAGVSRGLAKNIYQFCTFSNLSSSIR